MAAMAGVLLFVLAGVALEWAVVTEVERIEVTLDGVAAALVANDLQRVNGFLSESAAVTRRQAAKALALYVFNGIEITDMDITVNRLTSPPTANAVFTARVSGRDKQGMFDGAPQLIGFTLKLRRESDRWLISGHELEGAPGGF